MHDLQTASMYDDVFAFHEKFVPDTIAELPRLLPQELYEFRRRFLLEEMEEFIQAHQNGNLEAAFDALIDLVYVALGTAIMMGLPWEDGWDEVQYANMRKVRAESDGTNSKRQSRFDVVKPEGWTPPDIAAVLSVACQRLDQEDAQRGGEL